MGAALLLFAAPPAGLDPHKAITRYSHSVWHPADGLPQDSVRAIAQTRDGYLWLGTQAGLARFDGVSFTSFDRRNSLLKHDHVLTLCAARDGSLWIGTGDLGGLYRLSADELRFAVTDTGIGIPLDRQMAIFQPFTQANGSNSGKHGGADLGLAVCSRLIKAMGGALAVESEVSQGSTFRFSVPYRPAISGVAAEEVPREAAVEVTPMRVLVAEDNVVNQRLAARLLEKRGHTVSIVSDGKEALKAIEADCFDLVLMDVQMPDLNGLEASELIRRREAGTGRHLPIIAMTAHAMDSDRERCLAAGMDGYVSKPVRVAELVEAIAQATAARKAASNAC